MFLDKINMAVSTVIHKVADKVADIVDRDHDGHRGGPAVQPKLPPDTASLSHKARQASYKPEKLPTLPERATAAGDAVYRPKDSVAIDDLVYRPDEDGPSEPNLISYTPGQESGGWGPIKIADGSSHLPLPGRGRGRQPPPSNTAFV